VSNTRDVPNHPYTPAQLMIVLGKSFFDGQAIYIIAERCHPENPTYLLHSDTPDAPNQIRWRKWDGVWRVSFGLSYFTEKALIQTALEKGIPQE
jgi:hypothetical protein